MFLYILCSLIKQIFLWKEENKGGDGFKLHNSDRFLILYKLIILYLWNNGI